MHYCNDGQGPDPMQGDPCPGCTIESLRAELEEAKAALAAADKLYNSYTNQIGDTNASERYRLARALRDAKGEK